MALLEVIDLRILQGLGESLFSTTFLAEVFLVHASPKNYIQTSNFTHKIFLKFRDPGQFTRCCFLFLFCN